MNLMENEKPLDSTAQKPPYALAYGVFISIGIRFSLTRRLSATQPLTWGRRGNSSKASCFFAYGIRPRFAAFRSVIMPTRLDTAVPRSKANVT